ncbi:hypothetical protein [Pseudomonas syringae]|uniref:hypothetical protein n=1 Tax=Pseudomonas syringae TaxID=317 RepID=UPI001BD0B399|nr:hypothetical protein [Pseudomonas syringae]MBS7463864.1 hypothetical protein [Pseudomonas syringae]
MISERDRPEPRRLIEDQEHCLYLAYKWDKDSSIPSAAVIFYEADAVMRIAEVLTGPWQDEQAANSDAEAAAEKWLWDNSSNNWNPAQA